MSTVLERSLSTTLPAWRERHASESIVVCGCGPSLKELEQPERLLTIGVNDIGRLFDPTYLVVVNPRSQFKGDRFRYVEQSKAQVLFTHLDLGHVQPRVVRFTLGKYAGTGPAAGEALPYTQNSPYVAVCLAAYMGAKRIGLIGVDFTDHHFFGRTGRHPLASRLAQIDREYGALADAFAARGVELVNLSGNSRLTSLRKVGPAWLDDARAQPVVPAPSAQGGLRIVSYATTPVAGVPSLLARCIDAATEHSAECVWAGGSYGNGVAFAGGTSWRSQLREAMALLDAADVVIVHNGKVDPAHRSVLQGKSLVTMAHNYGWNVDMQHVQSGQPGVVVGQYQATLPEFAGWGVVPNPIPLWEPEHAAGAKGDLIHIAYTPSGRHESYAAGHRLYWHGKGWHSTMAVLHRLARLPNVRIETTEHGQITHEQALAMKRRAHIIIDECVTGSYHRNSLEGLATGAVVVNGVGLLPGVEQALRRCAPEADALPFVFSTLDGLESTLRGLIDQGASVLAAHGRCNRAWMEQHWNFAQQWPRFWAPVCTRPTSAERGTAPASFPSAKSSREPQMPLSANPVVSVVVPHGGGDRLRHLAAALASLQQQDAVGEVIVSEMGVTPTAQELARTASAKYVFILAEGPFERARALNVGSSLAEQPLVLWFDNDLVVPPGFVARAARELRERRLDYMLPYTAVHYLSDADSAGVMAGDLRPADCRAVRVLYSGRAPGCSGGAGLVTRDFLQLYGGFIEGFRGWGGEDNAWNVKVRLLGRWAATKLADQHAYHLFHDLSAGYPGQSGAATNPHYGANVALLQRVQRIRSAREFLRQFPRPVPEPCALDPVAQFFVVGPRGGRHEAATIAAANTVGTTCGQPHIRSGSMPKFRNVFACLVHDSQECVIDLVRNLRYMDPASTVLLYNGGRDPSLLTRGFPFDEYGAVVHPRPRPQSWGRLHEFALDCMSYSLEHLTFDAITIVDSDQLAARCGYTDYIAPYFHSNPLLGLFGSSAAVQPRTTRVAPVVAAYREQALWQPFLSRFRNGTSHFGRWTFWPTTAFSAAAARDLTHLFAKDEQLHGIIGRSQIWASEEVIFPMLVGALGYHVVESPCSYDYVRFRVAYTSRDIDLALTRPNVFWVHPVNRHYDDPLRARIRSRFNHYERPNHIGVPMPVAPERNARPLFLTSPILKRMRAIEGWLEDEEADVLIAATACALDALPAPHAIVEIGSYCGRSTVVLGAAAQAHQPNVRVYAIDPHDGVVGALDQGLHRGSSTLALFQDNIAAAGLQNVVVTIQQRSVDVEWTEPVSLLFIDGLHDYANVSRDFHHFASHIVPGGLIAFHDYADYYPGVKAFVNELLASTDYEQVVCARSMMLLRKREAAGAVEASARHLLAGASDATGVVEDQRATA